MKLTLRQGGEMKPKHKDILNSARTKPRVYRVMKGYKSGFYGENHKHLSDALEEANRVMESPHCNQKEVYVVEVICGWKKEMVPEWVPKSL